MDTKTADTMAWLLAAEEPSVRYLARHDLLGEDSPSERAATTAGPWMSALLAGQHHDGGFGGDPYRKWTGAHWRSVSLAELAAPASDPRVAAAAEHVLAWIVDELRRPPRVVDGLPRAHASIHGNALGACTRLGLAGDERTQRLAWQWPDGGWNCDNRADGHRSSFHGGSVDELLGVAIECPALQQFQVEVGRASEDRVSSGLASDDGEDRHLHSVDEAGGHQRPVQRQAAVRAQRHRTPP